MYQRPNFCATVVNEPEDVVRQGRILSDFAEQRHARIAGSVDKCALLCLGILETGKLDDRSNAYPDTRRQEKADQDV